MDAGYASSLLKQKGHIKPPVEPHLAVSYKTAWFMSHRLREAMKAEYSEMLGGNNPVEADETFLGTKPGTKKRKGYAHKNAVLSLVERNGQVRSFHVPSVNADTLKPIFKSNITRDAHLMTDDAGQYFLSVLNLHNMTWWSIARVNM